MTSFGEAQLYNIKGTEEHIKYYHSVNIIDFLWTVITESLAKYMFD